ncbi:MAG: hypothetical protein ABI690_13560 [Chloroflexota bacterium]
MSEQGIDLETGHEWNKSGLNGHTLLESPAAMVSDVEILEADEPSSTAHVDPARGVFITSKDEEIEMSGKRITALMLERVANQGKPRIPEVEVIVLGKKRSQPNANHEGYLAQLKEWEAESRLRSLQFIYNVGVKGQPPQDFIDTYSDYFPGSTDTEMKYLWVSSLIPDDDVEAFTEAVMAYTAPTTKGMEEAADSFRRNS